MRLLYVALTRAVHRCYLVIGPYDTHAKHESARSMLNWLAAGNGCTPADWLVSKPTTGELDGAWGRLSAGSGGTLVIDPLPAPLGVPLPAADAEASLTTPAPPGNVPGGWRISSYSGLSHGTRSESAAGDHDARTLPSPAAAAQPEDLASDDILHFPRGAEAGECIHAVFERVDFP